MVTPRPDDAEQQLAQALRDFALDAQYWTAGADTETGMARAVLALLHDWHDDARKAARDRAADTPVPYRIGAGGGVVERELLVTGRAVDRYTNPVRGGRLRSAVPCCDRPIILTIDTEYAVCPACRMAYAVAVEDEGDDGWGTTSYLAVFTVEHHNVVLARTRTAMSQRTKAS